jgi:hypothetical protein
MIDPTPRAKHPADNCGQVMPSQQDGNPDALRATVTPHRHQKPAAAKKRCNRP